MCAGQKLLDQLNEWRGSRTLVVGIGNVLKGDDAAGSRVCERLGQVGVGAELIDAGTAPENYIQPIIRKAPQNLLVVDAIDFGASPGTIRLFRPEQLSSVIFSTHTLSPRIFVDMIRREIDVNVFFVGLQPAQVRLGQPVSEEVNRSIEGLVRAIAELFPRPTP